MSEYSPLLNQRIKKVNRKGTHHTRKYSDYIQLNSLKINKKKKLLIAGHSLFIEYRIDRPNGD